MPATLTRPNPPSGEAPPSRPAGGLPLITPPARSADDAWPNTSRWLPWMLALFLVMVWLVPFDSLQANINLPVDAKLDRFAIVALTLVWLVAIFAGGRATPRWRPTAIDVSLLVFVGLAVLSVVLNAAVLSKAGDLSLAIKQLSLLFSYALFFFIAATTLRPGEVTRFAKLIFGLALVTAAGVLYQRYSHRNLFFDWLHYYLPGGAFSVRPVEPLVVSGPAQHPLATAAMFCMAMPFALVGAMRTRAMTGKVLRLLAAGVFVWAAFATGRKTGDFAVAAGLLALIAVRPRQMFPFVLVALVALGLASVLKPNAVKVQFQHVNPSVALNSPSSIHRRVTYPAIIPDVRSHPMLGRGYGSYDPTKYRILDNNGVKLLIEVGLLGLGAFVGVLVSILGTAWRALRSHDPARTDPALAAVAGTAAFATTLPLFDTLAYPQEPYLLLFLAALVVASRPARKATDSGAGAAAAVLGEEATQPTGRLALGRVARRRGFEEEPGRRRIGVPLPRRSGAERAPEHVEPPAHEPGRRHRIAVGVGTRLAGGRAALARARQRGGRLARTRAGRALTMIAALGLAAALFGRGGPGGSSHPLLGQGQGGGEPFASFPAGAVPRKLKGFHLPLAGAARGLPHVTLPPGQRFVASGAPSPAASSQPTPSAPQSGGNGVNGGQPPHHYAAPLHRHQGPPRGSGTPPQQPQTPSSTNNCLPPDVPPNVAQVLNSAGINGCNLPPSALDRQLRAAVANGTLSPSDYQTAASALGLASDVPTGGL